MASMQTIPQKLAFHATQLAPHVIQAKIIIVHLALFHCIFITNSVWLRAALSFMPRHLLQHACPAIRVAILVQGLKKISVYLVLDICISTLTWILAIPHAQLEPIQIQLLIFAHLVTVLALLVQQVRARAAWLAQSLCITKLQRNSVFQPAIFVNILYPLQLPFAQPVILLAQPVLEVLQTNAFHAAAHCI